MAGLPDGSTSDEESRKFVIGGNLAWQPPLSPVEFGVDLTTGAFSVKVSHKLVTPLGAVTMSSGMALKPDGKELAPDAVDVTQLIICQEGTGQRTCEAFQISSGRTLELKMDGRFLQKVSRNRITVDAAPGSAIKVTDAGEPRSTDVHGPAQIAIRKLHLHETGPDTLIDLEADFGGNAPDIAYDHLTGELEPYGGGRVSKVVKHGAEEWNEGGIEEGMFSDEDKPVPGNFLPGENDCASTGKEDWSDSFGDGGLDAYAIVACVKTSEADIGYVVIHPREGKPREYHLYSRVWVR